MSKDLTYVTEAATDHSLKWNFIVKPCESYVW